MASKKPWMSASTTKLWPRPPAIADGFQGLRRASLRTEPVATRLEVRLEDRLHYDLRRHLHHPVPHRRYPQRPLPPVCFGYVSPPSPAAGDIGLPSGRPVVPSRNCATPCSSIIAAWLGRRRPLPYCCALASMLSSRTSLRQIRSYSAWKRRVLLRLAHTHSLRWSSRTLSTGVVGVSGHALALTSAPARPKQGPFPPARCLARLHRYYEPLGLPPGTAPFPPSAYRHRLRPTWPPGRVSPVPHLAVSPRALLHTPRGVLHPLRSPGCSLLPSP